MSGKRQVNFSIRPVRDPKEIDEGYGNFCMRSNSLRFMSR